MLELLRAAASALLCHQHTATPAAGFVMSLIFVMGMWRQIKRTGRVLSDMIADEAEFPHLDVFVVCYNEPIEVGVRHTWMRQGLLPLPMLLHGCSSGSAGKALLLPSDSCIANWGGGCAGSALSGYHCAAMSPTYCRLWSPPRLPPST